jgi:hypothetical protein
MESSVSVVARGDLWRAEASHSSNSAAASASAPTGADSGAGYGARSGDASRPTNEWLARSGGPAKRHGRRVGCSHGPASDEWDARTVQRHRVEQWGRPPWPATGALRTSAGSRRNPA